MAWEKTIVYGVIGGTAGVLAGEKLEQKAREAYKTLRENGTLAENIVGVLVGTGTGVLGYYGSKKVYRSLVDRKNGKQKQA